MDEKDIDKKNIKTEQEPVDSIRDDDEFLSDHTEENSLDDPADPEDSIDPADEEEDWLDEEDEEEEEETGPESDTSPLMDKEKAASAESMAVQKGSGKKDSKLVNGDSSDAAAAVSTARKSELFTKRKMMAVIILLLILLILGGFYIYLMSPERWDYKIKLNGPSQLELYQGDKYIEKGAEATCKNTLTGLERKIPVHQKGKVDSSKTGTYVVNYNASYLGKTVSVKRTVVVKENLVQARSMSMYDTVSSSDTSPVIGLYGGSSLTVYDAFGFKDGYVATDDTEGYITDRVHVSGQVDTQTPGSYLLNYSVVDEDGQMTVAERLVTVKHYEPVVPEALPEGRKIIYLTFDDGPGKFTEEILSILDKYGVKATFFVTATSGEKYYSLIRKEAERGHAIGVHTYTHSYNQVYSNDQAYWDDFHKMNAVIENQIGYRVEIMRFPGGSSNTVSKKYCEGIMTRLANEATSQNYTYFDWNVSSGDASGLKDSNKIVENMKEGVMKNDRSIVLCHDTHEFTKNAVEPFLQWALSSGYYFDILRNGDFGAHQSIAN